MSTHAYGLRVNHPIFHSPIPVDTTKTRTKSRPKTWSKDLGDELEVLPLLDPAHAKKVRMPGWCAATKGFDGTPEMEVICGGYNSKGEDLVGIWRQGNLLHFGFEPDPSQYNDNGRALLVNAIAYASRFADDRPLFRRPGRQLSPNRRQMPITPSFVARWRKKFGLGSVKYWFTPAVLERVPQTSAEAFWAWFDENEKYLRTGESWKLEPDEDAIALKAPPRADTFFERVLAALEQGGVASERAGRLLARYAPKDAPHGKSPAEWKAWYDAHRRYIFFCQPHDFRWHLDPVAKKRGIPTTECRGLKRAGPAPAFR